MEKLKLTLLLTLIITLFPACKKDHSHEDPASAEITIYSPSESQGFDKGDTVFIKAKISGSAEMHGYEVHLRRVSDNAEMFLDDKHIEATNYDINGYWVNDGAIKSDMVLEVVANLDHEGNTKSQQIKCHCHDH